MTTPTLLASLRDALADLYQDEPSARRIVAQSGLGESRIEFSGRSVDTWHSVLTEAEKAGGVEAMIDIAVHEYGDNNNKLLRAALEWYRAQSRSLDTPATPAEPYMPIDFDWVTIPAGKFQMGSDKQRDPEAYENELPEHHFTLPEFRISRLPVTDEQYEMFASAAEYSPHRLWYWENRAKQGYPVVNVSWDDAQAFCRWAGVRLPTEAEWEKAARGSDGRIYPWGDESLDEPPANIEKHRTDDCFVKPVGSYPKGASPYGVLDMAGNIWEWTSSLFWSYPYSATDGRESGQIRTERVMRGGSGFEPLEHSRCASRHGEPPDVIADIYGFRVVAIEPPSP